MTGASLAKMGPLPRAEVKVLKEPWKESATVALKATGPAQGEDDGTVRLSVGPDASRRNHAVATAMLNVAKGHIEVADAAPVPYGLVLPAESAMAGPKENTERFLSPRNVFECKWAIDTQKRLLAPMSDGMKHVVAKMYNEGVESSHKWDPASVAEQLLRLPELAQDWPARLASSGKNVQSEFQKAGLGAKEQAKAQAKGAAASSGGITTTTSAAASRS